MITEGDWIDVDNEPGLKVRYGPDVRSGRLIVTGLLLDRSAVTAEMLRKIPLSRIEAAANLGSEGAAPVDLPPLDRPGDGSLADSDAFSMLVARHYRAWASTSPHPAARMAEAAGRSPATVHSWIYRARLRGFLPLGTRGKAG